MGRIAEGVSCGERKLTSEMKLAAGLLYCRSDEVNEWTKSWLHRLGERLMIS